MIIRSLLSASQKIVYLLFSFFFFFPSNVGFGYVDVDSRSGNDYEKYAYVVLFNIDLESMTLSTLVPAKLGVE